MVSYCNDKNEWKRILHCMEQNLWIKEIPVFAHAVITIYGVFIINKYRITFFWFRAQNIEQQSYRFLLRWNWGEINIFQVDTYSVISLLLPTENFSSKIYLTAECLSVPIYTSIHFLYVQRVHSLPFFALTAVYLFARVFFHNIFFPFSELPI